MKELMVLVRSFAAATTLLALSTVPGRANNYTVLHNFGGTLPNGQADANYAFPATILSTGTLLGTSYNDGGGFGTYFEYSAAGGYKQLLNFDGQKEFNVNLAARPLVNIMYGVCRSTANSPYGNIVRVNRDNSITPIYTFTNGADGAYPSGLTVGRDGNLYAITNSANGGVDAGTFVRVNIKGQMLVIATFHSPLSGFYSPVVEGQRGEFYTACYGTGNGSVLRLRVNGNVTVVHNFSGAVHGDGGASYGRLAYSPNGMLYGTTAVGGTYGFGTIFGINTLAGGSTSLPYQIVHSFTKFDGGEPDGVLIDYDGLLYGSTAVDGNISNHDNYQAGTIYKCTAGGLLTVLHLGDPTGGYSIDSLGAQLVAPTGGAIEGTYQRGGANGAGTLFSLNLTGPSVDGITPQTVRSNTYVLLRIYGHNFDRKSVVTWYGTPVHTTFRSSSEVDASVGPDINSPVYWMFTSYPYPMPIPIGILGGDGSLVGEESITLQEGAPVITQVSPASEPAGTTSTVQVWVAGTGFDPNTTVTWNGQPIVKGPAFDSTGFYINVTPSMMATAGTNTIVATNPSTHLVSNSATFTVTP